MRGLVALALLIWMIGYPPHNTAGSLIAYLSACAAALAFNCFARDR